MLKKALIILGCAVLLIIGGIATLLILLSKIQATPDNYETEIATGSPLEARYIAPGAYQAKKVVFPADSPIVRYTIHYPEQLEYQPAIWPVVIMTNGTGILPEKYEAIFRHLASWGIVVAGNDDPSTGRGTSANATLDFILAENRRKGSVLYGHIDTLNIGISGHSQGGAGVFNAITDPAYRPYYRAAVALSPTNPVGADALKFPYDLSEVQSPTLLLAGTKGDFETKMVIPIEHMDSMYSAIRTSKAMARRIGADHGQMLYSADGYATAWFMWLLKGDSTAVKAFSGNTPEIKGNKLYQNQKCDIADHVVRQHDGALPPEGTRKTFN